MIRHDGEPHRLTEKDTTPESAVAQPPQVKKSTAMDLVSPFRVILFPLRALKELAASPSAIGLVMLSSLMVFTSFILSYVTDAKIILSINNQSVSVVASGMFSNNALLYLAEIVLRLITSWFVYAVILLLLTRLFGGKRWPFRPFFMVVGFVFSVFIVRTIASTILISTLPDLHLNISTWPPTTTEDYSIYLDQYNAMWASTLASQVASWLFWIVYAWFVALTAVVVHNANETPWTKSIMISVTAFLIVLTLSAFLPLPLLM